MHPTGSQMSCNTNNPLAVWQQKTQRRTNSQSCGTGSVTLFPISANVGDITAGSDQREIIASNILVAIGKESEADEIIASLKDEESLECLEAFKSPRSIQSPRHTTAAARAVG